MSAKVLGAGAMVTYLELRVQRVKELVKSLDKGVSTSSESLHHLAGILVGICDLGSAPRAAFPFYHEILSRSFSRGVGGGGHGGRALARQAIRHMRTITGAGDP